MSPECIEIKKRAGPLAEGLSLSGPLGLFFLEDDWIIALQLPVFPQQMAFGMERNSGCSLGSV